MEINPTIPQDDFIFGDDQFPAFVGGFGSGKTDALIIRRILGMIAYPKNSFGFYEPTYDLIRQIAWPRFEEKLEQMQIPYKLTKSPTNELQVEGCGKIIFRSMDTPQRIIGYEVADSDVDELDTLKEKDAAYVWRQIVARNRQKKFDGSRNTIAVATTPEGFKFVYNTWEKSPKSGYKIIRAPTYSNPYLDANYVESLRDIYPPHLLDAYIEGRFVNLIAGSVYGCFDRELNGTTERIRPREPLHIGMDFNVNNMTAIVHVIRDGKAYALDEINGVKDTPAMIEVIRAYYDDHNIMVYPDASGNSRKTVDASTSDLQLLRDAKFRVVVDPANPRVKNRLMAMNAMFLNATGDRRYFVNIEKCPDYTLCLEQQAYDKNGEPDKSGDLDHAPDAAGYFIHQRFPIVRRTAKVTELRL